MSVQHANRGVVKKDLQLYYNREFPKSFRGQATTNIAYATNSFLNSNGNWWVNSGNTVFNDNDTTIDKPVILNVDTSNLRIFSSTVTVVGNQQLGSSIIPISGSTQYSMSIYYWFSGGSMQVPPYVRANINNNDLAYFGYNGDTNYLNWPRRTWIRLTATFTTQANETGVYMSSYTGDTAGEKLAYFGYQLEQKAYVTPLVLGSRSANTVAGGGGLLDISGNNVNADLSNVSFDSNGYYFDGSASYINLGTSKTSLNISSDLTVEAVIKLTSNFTLNPTIIGNGYWQEVYPYKLQFEYNSNNGNLGLFRYDGTNYRYALWNFGSQNTYFLNKTVHIVATYSSLTNTFAIYYNGVSQTITSSNPGNISVNNTTNFAIGAQIKTDGTKGDYFPGTINLVRVYNRALTASEVLQNFNATRTTYGI